MFLTICFTIVPEEGWFGQPKYSTPSKKIFYVVSVSASIFHHECRSLIGYATRYLFFVDSK